MPGPVFASSATGQFPTHMRLSPLEFAYSYITRSGRVDMERLRKSSPDFVAAYEAQQAGKARTSGSVHPSQ